MELKATKYKTESQKSSGLDGWISFNPMHMWRKVILGGEMQTLIPRDGQTNQQVRTFFSTPHSFQFPNVESVCLVFVWYSLETGQIISLSCLV